MGKPPPAKQGTQDTQQQVKREPTKAVQEEETKLIMQIAVECGVKRNRVLRNQVLETRYYQNWKLVKRLGTSLGCLKRKAVTKLVTNERVLKKALVA